MTAYERTIESGLQTFVEVGAALSAIRDSKLYRASYGTFGDYCRERWGMSRPRAYQLIESASTVSTIVDKGQPPPATESQARPLAKLPAEEQAPPARRRAGVFFDKSGGGIVKTRFSAG